MKHRLASSFSRRSVGLESTSASLRSEFKTRAKSRSPESAAAFRSIAFRIDGETDAGARGCTNPWSSLRVATRLSLPRAGPHNPGGRPACQTLPTCARSWTPGLACLAPMTPPRSPTTLRCAALAAILLVLGGLAFVVASSDGSPNVVGDVEWAPTATTRAAPEREGTLARVPRPLRSHVEVAREAAQSVDPGSTPATSPTSARTLVAGTVESRVGAKLQLLRVRVEREFLMPTADSGEAVPVWRRVPDLEGETPRTRSFRITTCAPIQEPPAAAATGRWRVAVQARDHARTHVEFEVGRQDLRVVLTPSGSVYVVPAGDAGLIGGAVVLTLITGDGERTVRTCGVGGRMRFADVPAGPASLLVTLAGSEEPVVTLEGLVVQPGEPCADPRLDPLLLDPFLATYFVEVRLDGSRASSDAGVWVVFAEGQSPGARSMRNPRTTRRVRARDGGVELVAAPGTSHTVVVGAPGFAPSAPTPLLPGLSIALEREAARPLLVNADWDGRRNYIVEVESLTRPDWSAGARVEVRAEGGHALLWNAPSGHARVRLAEYEVGGIDGGPLLRTSAWLECEVPAGRTAPMRLAFDLSEP